MLVSVIYNPRAISIRTAIRIMEENEVNGERRVDSHPSGKTKVFESRAWIVNCDSLREGEIKMEREREPTEGALFSSLASVKRIAYRLR